MNIIRLLGGEGEWVRATWICLVKDEKEKFQSANKKQKKLLKPLIISEFSVHTFLFKTKCWRNPKYISSISWFFYYKVWCQESLFWKLVESNKFTFQILSFKIHSPLVAIISQSRSKWSSSLTIVYAFSDRRENAKFCFFVLKYCCFVYFSTCSFARCVFEYKIIQKLSLRVIR